MLEHVRDVNPEAESILFEHFTSRDGENAHATAVVGAPPVARALIQSNQVPELCVEGSRSSKACPADAQSPQLRSWCPR